MDCHDFLAEVSQWRKKGFNVKSGFWGVDERGDFGRDFVDRHALLARGLRWENNFARNDNGVLEILVFLPFGRFLRIHF